MNVVSKLSRWGSTGIILFSSLWMINSAYLGYIFTRDEKESLLNGEVQASMVTGALSGYWPALVIVGILYFSIGCYLVWKVKNHLVLYFLFAASSFIIANILNVVAVSAGFELS